jgi:hypothetical protein
VPKFEKTLALWSDRTGSQTVKVPAASEAEGRSNALGRSTENSLNWR